MGSLKAFTFPPPSGSVIPPTIHNHNSVNSCKHWYSFGWKPDDGRDRPKHVVFFNRSLINIIRYTCCVIDLIPPPINTQSSPFYYHFSTEGRAGETLEYFNQAMVNRERTKFISGLKTLRSVPFNMIQFQRDRLASHYMNITLLPDDVVQSGWHLRNFGET